MSKKKSKTEITEAEPVDVKTPVQGVSMSDSYNRSTSILLFYDIWLLTLAAVGWVLAFTFGLVSNDYLTAISFLGFLAFGVAVAAIHMNLRACTENDSESLNFFVMNRFHEDKDEHERVKFDVAHKSFNHRLNRSSAFFNVSIYFSLVSLAIVLTASFVGVMN